VNTRNDTSVDPSISTALELEHGSMLDTIETMWPQIAPLQGARLRDAIRSVPETEWRERARILLALAASHRSVGSTSRSAALPWFNALDKNIKADPASPLDVRAGYLIQLAATLRTMGSMLSAREHLETVRDLLEQDQSLEISKRIGLSASFSLQLGLVRIHLGSYDEARFALGLAEGLADEHLSPAEKVECQAALAFLALQLGDFPEAEKHADLAEQYAEGTDLMRSSFAAPAQIARFMLLVEREKATNEFEGQLRDLRIASRNSDWEPQALVSEAAAHLTAGSAIEALDVLGRVTRLVSTYQGTLAVSTAIEITRAEALRSLGEVDLARRTAAELTPGQHHVTCSARILALAHFTVGDPQAALDALDPCLTLGDLHSTRVMAQIYAIAAAAHNDLGNSVAASIAFDRALLVAATSGIVWPFRALPREVTDRLLERAAERVQPVSVVALMQMLHRAPHEESQPLADPLSERELVIVRHLATGATLNQIGSELFISVNTVKSHVRSIYRKLSATNRREAIARAVQLGLAEAH
jgi:ATP/maltotriose-dependent transcriptional regulator MalT